jgi:hypothetical protein
MKSFLQFISESKSQAPYGVIFDGPTKAYVGSGHGSPIVISDELKEKVLSIGKKHGIWYEGNGGDIESNVKLFGSNKSYEGSWDDEFAKSVDGYPIQFMAPMFSNVKANNMISKFVSPKLSIFDSLIKNQKGNKYFQDRDYDANDLTKFLKAGSEEDIDFLKMSRMPATEENVKKFLTTGEKLEWPKNWQDYPNKLGKLAKKSEDERNGYLLNCKSGVYIVGSGHLLELKRLNKSLKIIGGE